MDSHSLESASSYLNNLLLARGLLRNGKAIDFAQPERANGGTEATMAKIINLVHDLVLRRDREAEQRESLASNIRHLRTEESQRMADLEQLQRKNDDITRSMSNMQSQERALKASLRKAETQSRELKEQMLKMKSTLDQVRAKCMGDVRKRDIELEKLKAHVVGLQRGKREATGMKINTMNPQPPNTGAREVRGGQDISSAEWSLEKETNDFLAALVNETSTENVILRKIVEETVSTLRGLIGLEEDHQENNSTMEDGIGISGQHRKSRRKVESGQRDSIIPCDILAKDMSFVLDHCRTILKDPSFVSIEEVQVRDMEILRLTDGWAKIASQWKDAVITMESWRKRMLKGESFDLEELKERDFKRNATELPNGEVVVVENDILSTAIHDEDDIDDVFRSSEEVEPPINVPLHHSEDESDLDIPPGRPTKRFASSPARRGFRLPRPVATLTETTGNARSGNSERDIQLQSTHSTDSGIGSLAGSLDVETGLPPDNRNDKQRSKIPRQIGNEKQPPLTVAEKLAVIEAEAREAEEQRQQEEEGPQKRKAVKRNVNRKAGRRRSTLSPEELANLMGVR